MLHVTAKSVAGDVLATAELQAPWRISKLKALLVEETCMPSAFVTLLVEGTGATIDTDAGLENAVQNYDGSCGSDLTVQILYVPQPVKHWLYPQNDSWTGCGGNPLGSARCLGSGNCSKSCENCGASTHWKCCGSSRKGSEYCTLGTTAEQAEKNYKLCTEPYDANAPLPVYIPEDENSAEPGPFVDED